MNNLLFQQNTSDPSTENNNVTNSNVTTYNFNNTNVNGQAERNSVYYASNLTSFAFIILVIIVIYFWRRYQRRTKEQKLLTKKEVAKFLEGSSSDEKDDLPYSNVSYNKSFEIKMEELEIVESQILGVGEYGMVYKGTYNSTPVAVKTLKSNANLLHFKSLLSELKIMISIGRHDNIVQCIGAHTGEISFRKLLVVVEYCKHGSLESFLRGNRSAIDLSSCPSLKSKEKITPDRLSIQNLLLWSVEICNGMKYLAEKKVIHGDLAIRNVLLDQNKIAKISDFGLSRQIFNCSNYVKTSSKESPLPWRWLAIETMKELNFSTKSDVWSFGIAMWEIYSLGQIPYPGLNYSHQFIQMLEEGLRMARPNLCSEDIYILMSQCWSQDPNDRPDFSQLHNKLKYLL